MILNTIPLAQGVSEMFSPRVTQHVFDFDNMSKVEFGEYNEASADADIINYMKSRIHYCIALGSAGNFQGSLKSVLM